MRRYLIEIVLISTLTPAAALARHHAYALIVGSNRAGPGQKPLKYAHNDARAVREVLTQLGGYRSADTQLMLDPGPEALLAALDHRSDMVA